MRTIIGSGTGLAFAFCALAALAAPTAPTHKTAVHGATVHGAPVHRAPARKAAHRTAARRAAGRKGPPSCAAISYRALPAGAANGEQQAGLYKSRFATLVLRATVKGGQAADYFVEANGKRLSPASGTAPPALAQCAAAKKLPAPGNGVSPCTGERFRVLVAHSGNARLAALYALQGGTWRFCNAGSF